MQTTGNLGLKKPEGTDVVDIEDFNGNADILDSAVSNKVDKVAGKQLSTEDYTTAEKAKLAGVDAGAKNYVHPVNHPPSIITQDASNRLVTDAEKAAWNGKASTVSPAFTGVPTAPTATGGTNTTQVATTAFVKSSIFTDAIATKALGNIDANTITDNGTYVLGNASTNLPIPGAQTIFRVEKSDNINYCYQIANPMGTNSLYFRIKNNGTWTTWSRHSNETNHLVNKANLNNVINNGYYYGFEVQYGPITVSSGYLKVVMHTENINYGLQEYTDSGTGATWSRIRREGVWQAWMSYNDDTKIAVSGVDLNTIRANGKYNLAEAVNKPTGSSSWIYLDVTMHTNGINYLTQTARDFDSNRIWERRCSGGIWTSWSEISTISPLVVGSYAGNGEDTRKISLPFTPSAVLLICAYRGLGYNSNGGGLAMVGSPVYDSINLFFIDTNSFMVQRHRGGLTSHPNEIGYIYNYIAYK